MQMTPAEQESYKQKLLKQYSQQAKNMANTTGLTIDEMKLPDFKVKLPQIDLKRLATIPKTPPTIIELGHSITGLKKQIEAKAPATVKNEVNKITEKATAEELHTTAIGEFYANKPGEALLIAINGVLKNPSEVVSWNNLAAIMNMTGLEHKAIPILMHHLQSDPINSMMLNNMGQAFLGLGDIGMAEMYLIKCLQEDPLNPEANRSMGMIKFAYDQYEEGMKYFEKELQVSHRRSTLALLKGKNKAFNIYNLRKRMPNMPTRNYFGELQFSNFKIPELPINTMQTASSINEIAAFKYAIIKEVMYWGEKTKLSEEQRMEEGKKTPGVYDDLVLALLDDLHELYKPEELTLVSEFDSKRLLSMVEEYGQAMAKVKCPLIPANATYDEVQAYQRSCCDMKTPVIDAFLEQYNSFMMIRAKRVNGVWKEYINDLINVVSLAPNAYNKIMVYQKILEYYSFLITCTQGQLLDPPMECNSKVNAAEADSIIEASHNLDLSCPGFLNIDIDLNFVKVKADCSKYAVEGGNLFIAGYEHSFKTGTTTLQAGVGLKAKFSGAFAGASIKQMLYVSFDNNNQFSDFGTSFKSTVGISDNPFKVLGTSAKTGGTLAGISGGYTLGINSGFKSSVKGLGALSWLKIE